MPEKDLGLEAIKTQLGEFGPYQLKQHLLHLVASFVAGIHMLALTFTAPTPEHRCFIPEFDEHSNPNSLNLSHFIPRDPDGKLSSCLKYRSYPSNSSTESCGGNYTYDPIYFPTSRVIEWNLVCNRAWMRSLLQSIYMSGVLFGAMLCGTLSDKFGRKTLFYLSALLQFLFGMVCAFAPNYVTYAIFLFFYGAFGSGGIYVTGFVLSMELVGASKRTICGTAFSLSFAVGEMLVPFWAWLIPHNQLLQLVYAAHGLLVLGHWCLIDESIPWLWSKGRTEEASAIATKAIAINGRYFKPKVDDSIYSSITSSTGSSISRRKEREGLCNLCRHPRLRNRVLIMAYAWFANALVYYGLAFNIGTLPGNPFLMAFINGLVEVPAYIIIMMLLDRAGRRLMESLLCCIGGLACILGAFLPHGAVLITLSMLAKIAVSGSFAICYNYGAELFPTSVRNSVLGLTSMAARMAGILTPAVIYLAEVKVEEGFALPTLVFGVAALVSSFLTLFLPETTGKDLPQGIQDGEEFGRGDTAFRTLLGKCSKRKTITLS